MARRPAPQGAESLPAVVLLWGDDRGGVVAKVQELRKAVLEQAPGMEAFNHERFDGPYTKTLTEVLTACGQLPIAAPRRLVELESPEAFAKHVGGAAAGNTTPDKALEGLVAYAQSPNPSTILLLSSTGIKSTSKLIKGLGKSGNAAVLRFETPKDRDAMGVVLETAQSLGFRVDRQAATALVQAVGGARAEIRSALERAHAYADGGPITREAVAAVVTDQREADVFALTDAVGQGNYELALSILAKLFAHGERDVGTGQRVFSLLVRQIRSISVARFAPPSEIGARLGVPAFIAKKYAAQAKRFDEERLARAYAALSRLDAEFKGGEPGSKLASQSPYLVLQRFVLDVCGAMPHTQARV